MAEFFKLNCSYSIDSGASTADLSFDALCLLESGLEAIEVRSDLTEENTSLFAALYCLRQALAVMHEVDHRINASEAVS